MDGLIVGGLAFGPSMVPCFVSCFLCLITTIVINKLGREVVSDVGCKTNIEGHGLNTCVCYCSSFMHLFCPMGAFRLRS